MMRKQKKTDRKGSGELIKVHKGMNRYETLPRCHQVQSGYRRRLEVRSVSCGPENIGKTDFENR